MQWLYKGQLHAIDQAWAHYRTLMPSTSAVQKGIVLGESIGNLVILQRKDDGAALAIDPPAEDYESDEPGKWRRDPVAQHGIAMGATWATHVQPFTLTHASQFVCPPPPNLTSAEYSMEFYETCAVGGQEGGQDGCIRDAWRTFVGRFWAYDGTSAICAPARLYMQIVHATLRQEFRHLDLPAKARIIGLAALAMTDAGLAAWHSKWLYRRERPITAVRESAAFDGNPLTTANPHWTALGAPNTNSPDKPNFTPPFPAAPSGHAAFGGAMTQVLRRVLGTDEARLQFISDEFDGHAIDAHTGQPRERAERYFSTFSEMEEENGQSRIYLGIHWASDKTMGIVQGRAVADWTIDHAYRPL